MTDLRSAEDMAIEEKWGTRSGERADGYAAPHGMVGPRGAEAHAGEVVKSRTGLGHSSRKVLSCEEAVMKN